MVTYEEWVLGIPEHLPRLIKEANEYARAASRYTTAEYLDVSAGDQVDFVEYDAEGTMDLRVPRSWFIDPNWRKQKEQEFKELRKAREKAREEQLDKRVKQTWATGYVATVRELSGEAAAEEAKQMLKEKGWL